jgi:hypothetical protein
MDRFRPRPFPTPAVDAVDRAIIEIDAAIELVLAGAARSVTLTGMPGLAAAAGVGAARAQDAAVGFRLAPNRPDTVVIGPRRPAIATPGTDRT